MKQMKHAYRACAEISLDALEYNVKRIREVIGDDTALMCVIKANAYGHGAVPLARHLAKVGADSFAVATVDEGIELRRAGITQPILILGMSTKERYEDLILHHITPTVYTYEIAKDISRTAAKLNMTADIHLKIDTGMSRIGFRADERTVQEIIMISQMFTNLNIRGIFTHFACADGNDAEMTRRQAEEFQWVIDSLEARGLHIPVRHCANSAAIIRYPHLKMDMVRAGIILYGLRPSDEPDLMEFPLKPVMRLKSHIIMLKNVPEGTAVGYGASFVCKRPTRIATVSIGYADGFPRAQSNKGRVLIGAESFPVIGRVYMDQMMVDVTDAQGSVRLGDEVILVGSQGQENITVEEASSYGDSFNYEFVCNINRRVPRVYYSGERVTEIVNYLD